MNVTVNAEHNNVLNIDGVPSLKAADGVGQMVLEEILKFKAGQEFNKPSGLRYSVKSQAWLNEKDKLVIFNINPDQIVTKQLVSSYLAATTNTEGSKVDTSATPLAGVLVTDTKIPLSLDVEGDDDKTPTGLTKKAKVVKVDKP